MGDVGGTVRQCGKREIVMWACLLCEWAVLESTAVRMGGSSNRYDPCRLHAEYCRTNGGMEHAIRWMMSATTALSRRMSVIECLYSVGYRRDMAGEWDGRRSRGWVNG